MNQPTDPTPTPTDAEPVRRPRRSTRLQTVVLAAAVCAATVLVVRASWPDRAGLSTSVMAPAPPPPTLAYDEQAARPDAPADPSVLNDPAQVIGGVGGSAEQLREPPAGLPVYEGARLWMGQQRRSAHWLEQHAMYAVEAGDDPDADLAGRIADHYTAAAQAAGFHWKPTGGNGPLNRVYVADRATLLVRVHPTDRDVRVTIIHRAALTDDDR